MPVYFLRRDRRDGSEWEWRWGEGIGGEAIILILREKNIFNKRKNQHFEEIYKNSTRVTMLELHNIAVPFYVSWKGFVPLCPSGPISK